MIRPPICPICKQPTESVGNDQFPFCSKRCREVDLLRWSKGEYVIPRDLDPEELAIREAMQEGEIPDDLVE